MDKYIFDESNGLWYELQGDYYIPCLILSEEETQPIGLWGQRHKQYLKEHKQFLYTTMLIEGTLNSYLADIDRQAQEHHHGYCPEVLPADHQQQRCREEQQGQRFGVRHLQDSGHGEGGEEGEGAGAAVAAADGFAGSSCGGRRRAPPRACGSGRASRSRSR